MELTPLKLLLENAQSKHYRQGQLLFYAGDTMAENFILKSGIIKVYDINDKGEEKVLQIIKAPALLPIDCLLPDPQVVSWYYSALTDVEVYTFTSEELQNQIATTPDFSAYIINWLAVEAHELMARIDGMSKSDAKNKVLTVLNYFNIYYTSQEKQGWRRIEFPITHQLIADVAGITRESATIQVGNLQREKIIRTRRPYIEINDQGLEKYLGSSS